MSRESVGSRRKMMDWQVPDRALGPLLGILATSYDLDSHFVQVDLLPALLSLGAWDDRSWSNGVAIERGLAGLEAISLLMDQRRYRGRPRSLRVEVFPAVGAGGQKLHAKVLLIVHERGVRFQVASANLTESGYRRNREVAVSFLATQEAPEAAALVLKALDAMPELLAKWWTKSAGVVRHLALERLRPWAGTVPSDTHFVWSGGAEPLLMQVLARWPASEAVERISIVSPFWSEKGPRIPLTRLTDELRKRGALAPEAQIDLYTEAEAGAAGGFRPKLPPLGGIDPRALGVRITARAVEPIPSEETGTAKDLRHRDLHAKIVILEGPVTALAYFGSANFTGPGWGFTDTGTRANVEAGVILIRPSGTLDEALLPPTTGKPVEIQAGTIDPVLVEETEKRVPTFIRGVWLEPDPVDFDRLRLTIRVELGRVRGPFQVGLAGEDGVVLLRAGEGCSEETHVALAADVLDRLLLEQQVRITWWESAEPCDYPVNVDLAARAHLPAVPGSPNPGEKLLLAYYQGKIIVTDLFPPPPGWEDDSVAGSTKQENEVDTSRIQSYQVREFVQALQGIRDDLVAASKGTVATMGLAVRGPVSPVALARQVREAVHSGSRGPTAAGFQLVEVATCLSDAVDNSPNPAWRQLLDAGRKDIESMLDELTRTSQKELGRGTSFARYAREVLGWRSKGGAAT